MDSSELVELGLQQRIYRQLNGQNNIRFENFSMKMKYEKQNRIETLNELNTPIDYKKFNIHDFVNYSFLNKTDFSSNVIFQEETNSFKTMTIYVPEKNYSIIDGKLDIDLKVNNISLDHYITINTGDNYVRIMNNIFNNIEEVSNLNRIRFLLEKKVLSVVNLYYKPDLTDSFIHYNNETNVDIEFGEGFDDFNPDEFGEGFDDFNPDEGGENLP